MTLSILDGGRRQINGRVPLADGGQAHVVGLDIGNTFLNLAAAADGQVFTRSCPSILAPTTDAVYGGAGDHTLAVTQHGTTRTYFTGDDALRAGRTVASMGTLEERMCTPETLIAQIAVGLHPVMDQLRDRRQRRVEMSLVLAVSIPMDDYPKDEVKRAFATALRSGWMFQCGAIEYVPHIAGIQLYPQGFTMAAAWCVDQRGHLIADRAERAFMIVDIGGGQTQISGATHLERQTPITTGQGMTYTAQRLMTLAESAGFKLRTLHEACAAMRSGQMVKGGRMVTEGVAELIAQAVADSRDAQVSDLTTMIRNDVGGSYLLIGGGGAHLYGADVIRQLPPYVQEQTDLILNTDANALGAFALAVARYATARESSS